MISYIKSDNHIHVVFGDGKSTTVYSSQPTYDPLVDAVKLNQVDIAYSIAFPSMEAVAQLRAATKSITPNVTMQYGIIHYQDTPMHGTLVDRMLSMINDGFDVSPMALFLENLQSNQSYRAVNELYGFLEKSNLPITTDGHFLAYKRVSSTFRDIRTGTFDNTPGSVVTMIRNEVDENKDDTCSSGLHFCAYDYLPHYANTVHSKIVLVKINPKDVVAIPTDYNDAKGRCCEYTVVCEVMKDKEKKLPSAHARIDNHPVLDISPGAVQQIQLDERFDNLVLVLTTHDSIHAAEKSTGIKAAYIKRVCNGDRKSTGGFGWRWAIHSNTKPVDADDAYQTELDDRESSGEY